MVWAATTATGRSPLVFVPSGVKLNSQRYISDFLKAELLPWARKHFDGAPWTLQQDSAPSHGSKMTQAGFRPTVQHLLAKMNGTQGARIWTVLTFMCGQFWRVRFAELLKIRRIIWSWSWYENGPWFTKKYCVPPVMLSRVDWSPPLKIKDAKFNKCFWLLV